MKFESAEQSGAEHSRTVDVAVARELIASEDLLKKDAHTQEMLSNNFMIVTGGVEKMIDPGDFLAERLRILEGDQARLANPDAWDAAHMVINSTDQVVVH